MKKLIYSFIIFIFLSCSCLEANPFCDFWNFLRQKKKQARIEMKQRKKDRIERIERRKKKGKMTMSRRHPCKSKKKKTN